MQSLKSFKDAGKAAVWYEEHQTREEISNDKFLRDFCFELSKHRIIKSYGFDNLTNVYVDLVDYYTSMMNELYERVYEYYNLYSPEQSYKNTELNKFLNATITKENNSMGMRVGQEDVELLKQLQKQLKNINISRKKFEDRIKKIMNENSPNLSKIAGELLGAQLIRHAGSLEKLSRMPSSTVQIMGAEKALFRHLTSKAKPPKHGLIFQHPMVNGVDRKHRGKMARALASKISIAAKVDNYSKKPVWKELLSDLEKKKKGLKK